MQPLRISADLSLDDFFTGCAAQRILNVLGEAGAIPKSESANLRSRLVGALGDEGIAKGSRARRVRPQ